MKINEEHTDDMGMMTLLEREAEEWCLSDDIDDNVGHRQYNFDDDFVGEV